MMSAIRVDYYQDPGLNHIPYAARPFTKGLSFYTNQVYVPAPYENNSTRPPNFTKDYNDPAQLNSMADALFNERALNKMSAADLQTKLPGDTIYGKILEAIQKADRPGEADLADIGQRLLAPIHILRTATLDPIAYGFQNKDAPSGFGTALMNAWQNFGETMDVLANPIKGMIYDGAEGFSRGLGTHEEGRKNYDFNFDLGSDWLNKPLEFIAEVLIDPFNWVTFGTKAAGKAVINAGEDAVRKGVRWAAQEVGADLTEEGVTYLAKQTLKKVRLKPNSIGEALGEVLTAASKPGFRREAVELASNSAFVNSFQDVVGKALSESVNLNVLSGLRQFAVRSDGIEKILAKSVGWSSGIIPGWKMIRAIVDPIARRVYMAGKEALQGAAPPQAPPSLMTYEPTLDSLNKHLAAFPNDDINDQGKAVVESFRAAVIQADRAAYARVVQRRTPDVLSALDQEFGKLAPGKTFREYVEHAQALAQRHPELEYHANDMAALLAMADNIESERLSNEVMKILKRNRHTIESSLNRLKNLDSFGADSLDALNALKNNLDLIAGDAASDDLLSALAADLHTLLNKFEELSSLPQSAQLVKEVGALEAETIRITREFADVKKLILKAEPALVSDEALDAFDEVTHLLNNVNWGRATAHELHQVQAELLRHLQKNPELAQLLPHLYGGDIANNLNRYENYLKQLLAEHGDTLDSLAALQRVQATREELIKSLHWYNTPAFQSDADDVLEALSRKVLAIEDKMAASDAAARSSVLDSSAIKSLHDSLLLGKNTSHLDELTEHLEGVNDAWFMPKTYVGDLKDIPEYLMVEDRIAELEKDVGDLPDWWGSNERDFLEFLELWKKDPYSTLPELFESMTELLDRVERQIRKDTIEGKLDLLDDAIVALAPILERGLEEVEVLLRKLGTVKKYRLMEGITEYALKQSQALSMLLLLGSDAAEKLHFIAQEVVEHSNFGELLDQLSHIPELAPLVNSVQGRAQAHLLFVEALRRFDADPKVDTLLPVFFDTMQSFKMDDVDKLMAGRGSFLQEFLESMQTQINSIEGSRLSLDWIFEDPKYAHHKSLFEDYLNTHGLGHITAHDAQYDVLKVEYFLRQPDLLKTVYDQIDQTKYIPVIYDIETTGTKIGSDYLTQIGWRTMDGEAQEILVELPEGMYPPHDFLMKQTDTGDVVSARAAYDAKHRSGKGVSNDLSATNKFLEQMAELEAKHSPPGAGAKQVMLIGWNSSRFDEPFLADVAHRSRELTQRFRNMPQLDGLIELRRLQGVPQITDEQTRAIRSHLSVYLDNRHLMEQGWLGDRHFIDTIDGGFASDLAAIDRYIKDQVDSFQTSRTLSSDQKAFKEFLTASGKGTMSELKLVADDIFTELRSIKESQHQYLGKRIIKDNVTGAFSDLAGNEIQIPGVSNVTQYMSTRHDALMSGATKIMRNGDIIKRIYEHLPDTTEASRLGYTAHFEFARSVVRLSDAAKNADLAIKYRTDFAELGSIFLAKLDDWYRLEHRALPEYLANITTDLTGTFDQYALTQQIYHKLREFAQMHGKTNQLVSFLESLPRPLEALKIIRRPEQMFSISGYAWTTDEWTSRFFRLREGELWQNGEAYIKEMYTPTTERFNDWLAEASIVRDLKHMGNASTQAGHAALQQFKNVWDKLMRYLKGDRLSGQALLDHIAESERAYLDFINRLSMSQLEKLQLMPAEKLEKYLWLANGRVTFGMPERTNPSYTVFMREYFDEFLKRKDALRQHNIHVSFDEGQQRMFLHLDNSDEVINKWLKAEQEFKRAQYLAVKESRKHAKTVHEILEKESWYREFYEDVEPFFAKDIKLPDTLQEVYDEAYELMANMTDGRSRGTLGDMISRRALEDLDSTASEALRQQFIPLDVFGNAGHFDSFNFNRSNLGLAAARRDVTNYVSGNIVKNFMNSAQELMNVMDARTKNMYLFFDQNHSLASGFYKDLSAEDMFKMLREHKELKLAGLVEDAKYGAMVREFKAGSPEDLAYWMSRPDLNMTIMPVHTYIKAHDAINNFRIGPHWLQVLNHWVVGPMKTGYLTSLGFVFRNLVDSFFKNLLLPETPEDVLNMTKHTFETAKYYYRYREIFSEMRHYADDVINNNYGMYSTRVLDRMYEIDGERLNKLMPKDLFQLFHDFIEQGPSAGLSSIQLKAIELKRKSNLAKLGLPPEGGDLASRLMNNPATRGIMSANSAIEQVLRLSGYTWSLAEGATTDQAMRAVIKYHYDYTTKSKAEYYADIVVPFSSFTLANTKMWTESFDRFGWMAGLVRDMFTPTWDFDGRDNEELAKNRSIQYHVLAGNVTFNDSNLVLKLNPSVTDAFRLLTDPEEILDKLIVFLRIPLDLMINGTEDVDWVQLIATSIPMIGPALYRWWPEDGVVPKAMQRLKGENADLYKALVKLLPSLFGAFSSFGDREWPGHKSSNVRGVRVPYTRKAGTGSRYYRKTRRVYPKYARRTWAKKSYPARKNYFRGTYATKSFATKSYVPRGQKPEWVMSKVLSTARGHQMRMPGAGSTMAKPTPGIYRKIYTGTGRSRFLSRMVPVTAQNLAARLKSDWAYLR